VFFSPTKGGETGGKRSAGQVRKKKTPPLETLLSVSSVLCFVVCVFLPKDTERERARASSSKMAIGVLEIALLRAEGIKGDEILGNFISLSSSSSSSSSLLFHISSGSSPSSSVP
jgi:hypothetical protein